MRAALTLALALLAVAAPAAVARPGDLDTTFGEGGSVRFQLAPDPDYPSTRVDLVRRAGTATLVAGTSFDGNYRQPFLARYLGDELDDGFGDDGIVRWRHDNFVPGGIAVDSTGRIVVALGFDDPAFEGLFDNSHTLVHRLDPSGVQDDAFGTDGTARLQQIVAKDLALAPNGRIAVGGQHANLSFQTSAVQVLGADGEPGHGATMRDPGSRGYFGGLGFDAQGRLLATAASSVGAAFVPYLARFIPAADGVPRDAAFGDDGVVVLPESPEGPGQPMTVVSLRVASDGSALVGDGLFRLLKVTAAGVPVAGFGDGGFSERADFDGWAGASGRPDALAIQSDGKIIGAGGTAVVRWTASGDLDGTYGDGGKTVVPGLAVLGRGIALEPGGKVVVGGTTGGEDPEAGVLARLLGGDAPVDSTPPDVTVTGVPDTVHDPGVELTVTADDPHADFECSIDGAAFFDCDDSGLLPGSFPGTLAWTAGANGPHSFGVRAIDQSGNAAVAEATWTTDIAPVDVLSGPSGRTNDPRPAFTFSAPGEGGGLQCTLDGGAPQTCDQGVQLESVGEGAHTLEVTRTGTWSGYPGATRGFTVDLTAPLTTVTGGPDPSDPTPEISFGAIDDDTELTYECRVVGAGNPFVTCTSPWTAPSLGEGRHYLQVRARDRAGNAEGRGATAEVVIAGDPGPGPGPGADPGPDPDPDAGGGGGDDGAGPGGGGGGTPGGLRLRGTLVGGIDQDCMREAAGDVISTPLGTLSTAPTGGLTGDVKTRGPGRATFTATTPAPKARPSGLLAAASATKRPRAVVYAKGSARVGASGYAQVNVRPTAAGKRIARQRKGRRRTVRLVLKAAFKPSQRGVKPVRVTKRLRLDVRPVAKTARSSQAEFTCKGAGHPPFAVVYLPAAGASKKARAAQDQGELSYCEEQPKKCVPTARFCAQGDNKRMFCTREDGSRRDPCVEDSSACLVVNQNQCGKVSYPCTTYQYLGIQNYIADWCGESPTSCEPEDACFHHPYWSKPRNPFDCEPALSHQYGLIGRPKGGSLPSGEPLEERRYPWWRGWFTNGPGNPKWPGRRPDYDPVTGGDPTRPAGSPPSEWMRPTTYFWPVDLQGAPLDPGAGGPGGGGGGSNACGFMGLGVLTVWGECAYAH